MPEGLGISVRFETNQRAISAESTTDFFAFLSVNPSRTMRPHAARHKGFPFPVLTLGGAARGLQRRFPMTALCQLIDIDKIGSKENDMNREVQEAPPPGLELYLDQEPEFVLGGLVLAAAGHQVAFKANDEEIGQTPAGVRREVSEASETKDESYAERW